MRLVRVVSSLMLLGALPACVITDASVRPTGVESKLHKLTLPLNDTFPLLSLMQSEDTGVYPFNQVKWHMNGFDVLKLDGASGLIKAIAPGFCVVTAEWKNRIIQFEVTVTPEPRVTVRTIAVVPKELLAKIGETEKVKAEVFFSNGERGSSVQWYSTDTTVARIDATTGVITAIGSGITTIGAYYPPDPSNRNFAKLRVYTPKPCIKKENETEKECTLTWVQRVLEKMGVYD